MEFRHTSVLLEETVDSLQIKEDGIYVDGTLGGGGHASEVLRRLGENGRLIGIDQDEDAIAASLSDPTPAELVTAIVTERGVYPPGDIISSLAVS